MGDPTRATLRQWQSGTDAPPASLTEGYIRRCKDAIRDGSRDHPDIYLDPAALSTSPLCPQPFTTPAMLDPDEVLSRFEPRGLTDEQARTVADVRAGFKRLADQVLTLVPTGREQSIVLTHLEEAAFMSVAGIARRP